MTVQRGRNDELGCVMPDPKGGGGRSTLCPAEQAKTTTTKQWEMHVAFLLATKVSWQQVAFLNRITMPPVLIVLDRIVMLEKGWLPHGETHLWSATLCWSAQNMHRLHTDLMNIIHISNMHDFARLTCLKTWMCLCWVRLKCKTNPTWMKKHPGAAQTV